MRFIRRKCSEGGGQGLVLVGQSGLDERLLGDTFAKMSKLLDLNETNKDL